MRMIIVLSASAFFFASGCDSAGSDAAEVEFEQARTIETGCPILLDFVKSEFKKQDQRPLHLSWDMASQPPPIGDLEETTKSINEFERSQGRNPNPETIKKQIVVQYRVAQMRPFEICPKLRKFSEANSFDPAPGQKPPATTKDGLFYHYDILSIEMPFIDFDKGTAGFNVARGCGPLCGAGSLVTYERAGDGSWKYKGEKGTWIS